MKKQTKNTITRREPWTLIACLSVALVLAVIVGLTLGYEKLHALWVEQCVIDCMQEQVVINSGKMVKADVIAGVFGLKPGANLALIDFAEKREQALAKIPNIRDLHITRTFPNRIEITFEERQPLARLGLKNQKASTGKVVDSDGVVFYCSRGTQLLPLIREPVAPGTAAGKTLNSRAKAALRFIEACRDTEFQEIAVLEVDISPTDWLLATINTGSNYASLKLAWEGMDDPATPVTHANLIRQLTHLRDAIRTRVCENAVIWNATDFSRPGRIYADTKGKL